MVPSDRQRGSRGRRGDEFGQREGSGRSRSSSSGGRESSRQSRRVKELHACRRRKLILKILLVFVVVGAAIAGWLGKVKLEAAAKDVRIAQADLQKQRAEVASMEAEVEALRQQMNGVVQGRVPGLNSLVFNEVIRLDEKYLESVIFTLARRGGQKTYQFKLGLNNKTGTVVEPRIALYLFDQVGLQIGFGETKGLGDTVLISDEQRFFDGEIELTLEGEPVYYMVKVK